MSRRKVALHEAFDYVPSKFINEKFKEHGHYYGAFFAILEAQRSLRTAGSALFAPLRARRFISGKTSATMMVELREDGYEFEELKREIDSAQRRRNREEGTIPLAIPVVKTMTLLTLQRSTECHQRDAEGSRSTRTRASRKRRGHGLCMLLRHGHYP